MTPPTPSVSAYLESGVSGVLVLLGLAVLAVLFIFGICLLEDLFAPETKAEDDGTHPLPKERRAA